MTFERAYRLVLERDGIPCYPTLADGVDPVCPWEEPPAALAGRLLERGIHVAELIPERNDRAVVDAYVSAFRDAGIVVMAGTEHNTQQRIPIEPRCRTACRRPGWPGRCSGRAPASWPRTSTSGRTVGRASSTATDDRPRASPTPRAGSAGSASSARSLITQRGGAADAPAVSRASRRAILDELIALARRFGEDPGFSRGGGGNASAKADGVLWIKPSGVPLATLQADALVPLDTARLLEMLESDPAVTHPGDDPVMRVAVEARLAAAGGRRPSVELLFHALLPERFVLHTHPILLNAVGCNRDGAELARRLFGDGVIWVPYTDPGLPLAHAIRAARAEHEARTGTPPPRLTLLANHGLIVTGDTAADIEDATAWLVERIEAAIAATPEPAPARALEPARARALVDAIAPTLRARLSTDARRRILAFDDDPVAASFTATRRRVAPSCSAARSRRTRSCTPGRGRSCSTCPRTRTRPSSRRCCASGSTPTSRRRAPPRSSSSCPGWACSPSATPGRRPTPPATSTSTRCASAPARSAWAPSGTSPMPSAGSSRRGRPRPTASRSPRATGRPAASGAGSRS